MEYLIPIATALFVLCYLPQLYTLWISKKWEGYNPWFQTIELVAGILMIIAMIGLSKGLPLIINYFTCSALAAACCLGWLRAKKRNKHGANDHSEREREEAS